MPTFLIKDDLINYPPLEKGGGGGFLNESNSLQFLYRIKGRGTLSLSRLIAGDTIQIIGPLGKGYPPPDGDFIALAGGIGIASLLPLLEEFCGRAYLFYGARNKDELVMANEAEAASKEIFITTDDGSAGQKGLVTEALNKFLNLQNPPSSPFKKGGFDVPTFLIKDDLINYPPLEKGGEGGLPIYACGPLPMLRGLSRVIANRGIKCYASLEEHMACGVGSCLGCVVKVKTTLPSPPLGKGGIEGVTYKRVCKEGPVFDMEEIVW